MVEHVEEGQLPSGVVPVDGPAVGSPTPTGNGSLTPDPVPASAEEVTFLPSGKIKLQLPGRTLVLRRPRLGEFRKLREVLYEEQDAANEAAIRRARELEAEVQTEADTPEAARSRIEEIIATSQRMRADVERQEQTYLRWTRLAIETLTGTPLEVSDDDLPFMFGTTEFVTAVQRHWRTVPLPSGVR